MSLSSWLTLVSRSLSPSKANKVLRLTSGTPLTEVVEPQMTQSFATSSEVVEAQMSQGFMLSPAIAATLLPGVTYTFILTATNAAGSTVIGTATATPFTTPGAPGVGTATVDTSTKTAVITFLQGPTNGSPITNYYYSTTGTAAEQPWPAVTTIGTASSGTNTTVTATISLVTDGTYTFNLQAKNTAGTGLPSPLSNSITLASTPYTITGFSGPSEIGIDNNNNVYVSNYNTISFNGSLSKIVANGTSILRTFTGFSLIGGIVADSNNNIYFTNNDSKIYKIAPNGDMTGISGFNVTRKLAIDSNNNIYVVTAESPNYQISKLASGSTTPTKISFGGANPYAIVVDNNDYIYVSNSASNQPSDGRVSKITPTGTVTIIYGFNNPGHMAVDSNNNVYVINTGNNTVSKIAAGADTIETTITGFDGPDSIAIDSNNNVYVTNSNRNGIHSVSKIAQGASIIGTTIPMARPYGIAIDSNNKIYIANNTANTVTVIPT